MKAKRAEPKQEFVPVIVTLESQEEVDSLYAVVNHTTIRCVVPVVAEWQSKLKPFRSYDYQLLHNKLDKLLYPDD